jgi:hypothetical protein
VRAGDLRFAWVGAVLALAIGCATGTSMRVRAEPNPSADLARYATYAWMSPPLEVTRAAGRTAGGDPWSSVPTDADRDAIALDRQVRREVDAQLARRGWVQVAPAGADLVVDYRVGTRRKELVDDVGEYSRYRAQGGTGSWGDVWVGGYREGELQVLVADARTRTWVWQGTATAVVNPALRERRIPKAVAGIFEGFPGARAR